MNEKTIGVAAMGGDSRQVLATIQDLESRGIAGAWLTTGGTGLDALTLFAAVAMYTDRIKLGTSIIPTWPRHPVGVVQQVQVLAQLAPGRFCLGVGPSHRPSMEQLFGVDFTAPLTNLREYLTITKGLLHEGSVEFAGRHYRTQARLAGGPVPDVPVMAAALRPSSFEVCGELADGAISWVSPHHYLRDVALPAMERGARVAGRSVPPLVAHAPVCVHDDPAEVRAAAREQLNNYPRLPFYARMFVEAGYPEVQSGEWSDSMLEAVVLSGDEEQVARRVREVMDWGATEVLVSIVAAGEDHPASRKRTLDLLAALSQEL